MMIAAIVQLDRRNVSHIGVVVVGQFNLSRWQLLVRRRWVELFVRGVSQIVSRLTQCIERIGEQSKRGNFLLVLRFDGASLGPLWETSTTLKHQMRAVQNNT